MAAYRYRVITPNGLEIQVSFADRDMRAVPLPRPTGEDAFVEAIMRSWRSRDALEKKFDDLGVKWTRLFT